MDMQGNPIASPVLSGEKERVGATVESVGEATKPSEKEIMAFRGDDRDGGQIKPKVEGTTQCGASSTSACDGTCCAQDIRIPAR